MVNKIDRPDQRIHEVVDEVLELLLDLNATEDQFDSPMLFCSGRQGTASYSPDTAGTDLHIVPPPLPYHSAYLHGSSRHLVEYANQRRHSQHCGRNSIIQTIPSI